MSCQFNKNKQVADATAINMDPKSVQTVTASADLKDDFSKSDVKRTSDGSAQANEQNASANITQYQNVSQQNINIQNAAVAIAVDHSDATATQVSYQANFNAQIAEANAVKVDIEEGSYQATAVMNGTDMKGDDSWAVSYDVGDEQVNEQHAAANITQVQYVEQLNVNEQYSAIAYAANDDSASASQVNYQVNENVQVAESNATNTDGAQNDQQSIGLPGSSLQLVA
ncbi:hypothetical protein [Haladaptatus halobius]|uniref:hypothetical protein n=1 Tax=Haladaptatus halobius TaxID=2884875 RepID=UPI001D09D9E6|nr:hypothetical protein [Haladaptatus halobius]